MLKEARNEYGNKRLDVGEVYDLAGRTLHRLPDRKRLPYWHPHYRPDTTIASAGEKAQVAAVDGQEVTVPSECIRGGENYRSLVKRGLDFNSDGSYKPTIEKKSSYWLSATAAAPFDYALDPALSVISTPVYWVGLGIAHFFHEIF